MGSRLAPLASVADVSERDALLAVLAELLEVADVVETVDEDDELVVASGVATEYRVFELSHTAHVLGCAGRTSKRPTPPSQQPPTPAQQ